MPRPSAWIADRGQFLSAGNRQRRSRRRRTQVRVEHVRRIAARRQPGADLLGGQPGGLQPLPQLLDEGGVLEQLLGLGRRGHLGVLSGESRRRGAEEGSDPQPRQTSAQRELQYLRLHWSGFPSRARYRGRNMQAKSQSVKTLMRKP